MYMMLVGGRWEAVRGLGKVACCPAGLLSVCACPCVCVSVCMCVRACIVAPLREMRDASAL
jgi:hypothetical protein